MSQINPKCRIGKVTFKDSKIKVFPSKFRRDQKKQLLIDQLIVMVDDAPEDLDGYVIVGWAKGGDPVFSSWDVGELPIRLAPEFVKETFRNHIDLVENGIL